MRQGLTGKSTPAARPERSMPRSTLNGSAVARFVHEPLAVPPPTAVPTPAQVPGLYVLCAAELCERLASAIALSLLVLYLNERLRFDEGRAARIASYVSVFSYLAGVLGGVLADRTLGARRAVLGGLLLLALGYWAMGSVQSTPCVLWVAAALLIAGSGLFKPNITVLLGALYGPTDPRRVLAFSSFYYAVNIGGVLGPCIGAISRAQFGWSTPFRIAAASTTIACALIVLGGRHITCRPRIWMPLVSKDLNPAACDSGGMEVGARIRGLVLVMIVLSVFGAVLSQSYSTLLLWARDHAERNVQGYMVPADIFAALPALFVLLLAPLIGLFSRRKAVWKYRPTYATKFTAGMLFCALGFSFLLLASILHHAPARATPLWLLACSAALAAGELLGIPVGLALVDRLAPINRRGLTLGLSYVALALGYLLGGWIGVLWTHWTHAQFFGILTCSCLCSSALIRWQSQRFPSDT